MKKKSILLLLLAAVLALALAGCGGGTAKTEEPDIPGSSQQEQQPQLPQEPENGGLPNDPDPYGVWRDPEEIRVYPFTEEEIAAARDCLRAFLMQSPPVPWEEQADGEPILAYDPIMVDVRARQWLTSDSPLPGWSEEDHYARRICICWDREWDENDRYWVYDLVRETVDGPWEVEAGQGGPAPGDYSRYAMTAEELARCSVPEGRILGGYALAGEHWFYVADDATGQVRFVQRPA